MIFNILYLVSSLSIIISRFINVAVWYYFIIFYRWVVFHCIYAPHLLYPLICGWIFRLLHILAIVNSAAMNIGGFPDSFVGKESACSAGDPSSISRSGRSTGEGIGYPLQYSWASLVAQLVKLRAGDLGLLPGLGRSPGEEKGYPFQYSGLENSIACLVHGVAKSQTWLSDSLSLWT